MKEREFATFSGMEAVNALIRGELSDVVWNKLMKRECFADVRFPVGRVFEDVPTTVKIFTNSKRVCSIPVSKYHYLQRNGSLSKIHTLNNILGYWYSHKERFDYLQSQVDDDIKEKLLRYCALAIARMWAYYYDFAPEERIICRNDIQEMNTFSRQYIPLFGSLKWPISLRTGAFLSHFQCNLSFRMAWALKRICYKWRRCFT